MTRTSIGNIASRGLRVVAVIGVVAATSFISLTARATNTVTFTCTPAPSSSPDLTPPPSAPSDDGIPPANNRTPPPACTPAAGEVVWGTRPINFTVQAASGQHIRSVALYLRADQDSGSHDANAGNPVFSEQLTDASKAPRTKSYTVSWDSTELTPYNGRYKIEIDSSTWNPNFPNGYTANDSPAVFRTNLRVDNEPAALPAVQVLATTASSVTTQWDKAAEPDVLSYTLYRAVTTGKKPAYADLRPVVTTQTRTFRDDDVKPASYWYSVKVTRRSIVSPQTGISSAFSPMSSAAVVEPTPPPTTSGGGGSSSSGGSRTTAELARRFVPLKRLTTSSSSLPGGGSVPDAPYSAYLPYDKRDSKEEAAAIAGTTEEGGGDPRGLVLPVAVGAFLVSSALTLGRMPF